MSITETTDATFSATVLQADKLVLVDYWAEWCGPCKAIAPILEATQQELAEHIQIVKINIDENPETPTKYGIRSIPTLMLFKAGEVIDTRIGVLNKNQIAQWIQEHI